jgi:hypothetical protein
MDAQTRRIGALLAKVGYQASPAYPLAKISVLLFEIAA